jgi:hypothetical protein
MTTKKELLKTIRQHCIRCCGGSWKDVENCTSGPDASPYSTCLLWQFRLGSDPQPSSARVKLGTKLAHHRVILDQSNATTEVQVSC